jgi:predicted MFS family arabinose efflux permease
VAQLVGWGTLYYGYALLFGPMEAELGWSRTDLNGALTAGLLATGLGAVPIGRLIDRFGAALPMTAGAVAGALLLVLWSRIDSLPAFYGLCVALGIAQGASLGDPAFAVITANARDARRAITALTLVTGLCTTVFFPLVQALIEHLGWRNALLALGLVQLLFCALPHALVLKGTRGPRRSSQEIEAGQRDGSASEARPVFRRAAFWSFALCFAAQAFISSGLTFHLVPLLQERGFGIETAVAVFALRGPAQVGARMLLLALGSKAPARRVGSFIVLLPPLALAALFATAPGGTAALIAFVVLYGVADGSLTIVRAAGIGEMLDRERYGTVAGTLSFIALVPKVGAPLAIAALWQWTGGYAAVIEALILAALVGAAGFWLAAARTGIRPAPTTTA